MALSLPDELIREIDRVAGEEGWSRSEVVREALKRFLWEWRFERLRQRMRGLSIERGILTDEEAMREVS